jgi:hypothetical protein
MRDHARRRAVSLLPFFLLLVPPAVPGAARAQVRLAALPAYESQRIEFAREGAMRRLRVPLCQDLLAEFRDAHDQPLSVRLATFGVPADQYLAMLPFLDGSERPLCKGGQSQLLTARGVARVIVCKPFLQTVDRERAMAEVYVIHEMLHTLGLGENPPSSLEITQRVKTRCAP